MVYLEQHLHYISHWHEVCVAVGKLFARAVRHQMGGRLHPAASFFLAWPLQRALQAALVLLSTGRKPLLELVSFAALLVPQLQESEHRISDVLNSPNSVPSRKLTSCRRGWFKLVDGVLSHERPRWC